jgi:uncharacterized protein
LGNDRIGAVRPAAEASKVQRNSRIAGALFAVAIALTAGATGCASIDDVTTSAAPVQADSPPSVVANPDPYPNDPPVIGSPPPADVSADAPANAPATASATGHTVESMVWVPAGDHRVPGTLALPAITMPSGTARAGADQPSQLPAVLLLHGDFSSRDENGDLFGRLAADLAARGIASLRIDFAGSGDSEEPSLALDYPNMVDDATAAVDFLRTDPRFDPGRVGVLGLSRGGSIAATLAGTMPGLAVLVEWSGAVYDGYDEMPDLHDQARADGSVTLGTDDGEFELSLNWFDSIEQSHPLDDVAGYTGPVLAIVGSDDDVVPPETSEIMLRTVASADTTLHVIEGADHEYEATGDDQTDAEEALSVTTDWLVSRLAP